MSSETIFDKIIRREIPADIVYEDDLCLAFRDIHPQAPIHILVVPKRNIPTLQSVKLDDEQLLGHLLFATQQIAVAQKIGDRGYRCIINVGPDGGQDIPHLHLHLLGGHRLGSLG